MIEFSRQQRQVLKKFLGRPPAYSVKSSAENFLLRYVFFEGLCRLVGKYYRERSGSRKKTTATPPENIQIDVVDRSLKHFGIRLRPECLSRLLDSSLDRRGAKSARNLRNGIVHRWDENDVTEALKRCESLMSDFDALIDAIGARVNVVAK